ncbi:hypothetical protein K432DRAFT_159347 [Lepidopterella palustris CBS 459.81]|uniref:Uncharacterized protein n=1 Tax=Lepidopterella palustris CBS 459.81 TaxID=1314670 RepID=A0A8E2EH44_9PEZI|nr:hypothetical protein K432DRAFT_159347 [Lepidopterella palustris CBS 459.81]
MPVTEFTEFPNTGQCISNPSPLIPLLVLSTPSHSLIPHCLFGRWTRSIKLDPQLRQILPTNRIHLFRPLPLLPLNHPPPIQQHLVQLWQRNFFCNVFGNTFAISTHRTSLLRSRSPSSLRCVTASSCSAVKPVSGPTVLHECEGKTRLATSSRRLPEWIP